MNTPQTDETNGDLLGFGDSLPKRAEAAAQFLGFDLTRNPDGTLVLERDLQLAATACELVAGLFGGDVSKTRTWFCVPNPMLGFVEPRRMVAIGRAQKLLDFIRRQLAENPLN